MQFDSDRKECDMSLGYCKDCVYCKRITIIPVKGMPEFLSADGRCIRHAPVVGKDGCARFPIVRVEPDADGDMTGCGDFEPAPKEELRKLRAKYDNKFLETRTMQVKKCQS